MSYTLPFLKEGVSNDEPPGSAIVKETDISRADYGHIMVKRNSDGAMIPFDPTNRDYKKYLAWVDDGNTPHQDPDPDA
jgi:hypothetical protein